MDTKFGVIEKRSVFNEINLRCGYHVLCGYLTSTHVCTSKTIFIHFNCFSPILEYFYTFIDIIIYLISFEYLIENNISRRAAVYIYSYIGHRLRQVNVCIIIIVTIIKYQNYLIWLLVVRSFAIVCNHWFFNK